LRGHGSPNSRTGTKAVAVPVPGRRTDFHSTPGFPSPLLRVTWEPFAPPRRLSRWWQCPNRPDQTGAKMSETFAVAGDLRHVTTFCGNCDCGCPELFLDDAAPPERRVVLTDDFGQRVQMS